MIILATLRLDNLFYAGILIKGCLRWQRSGLARQPGHGGRVNVQLPHHNVREEVGRAGETSAEGKKDVSEASI
jgi:hypothetical protein